MKNGKWRGFERCPNGAQQRIFWIGGELIDHPG
jgi:hypothetical protein